VKKKKPPLKSKIKNGLVTDRKGNKQWFRNGKLHRDDGPAVENADGSTEWYRNGHLHRKDGPAAQYKDGEGWYFNGQPHRDGGPAFYSHFPDAPNYRDWYRHGKKHREDGPAVEWDDGHKEWYLNDQELTEDQFIEWQEKRREEENHKRQAAIEEEISVFKKGLPNPIPYKRIHKKRPPNE
jgi:hypothetical protein